MTRARFLVVAAALAACRTPAPKPLPRADASDLRDSLNDRPEQDRRARFRATETARLPAGDGRYVTRLRLQASGRRRAKELSIFVRATNGARVSDIVLAGPGLGSSLISKEWNASRTERRVRAFNVPAQDLEARIITEGEPGRMTIRIEPKE